MRIGPVATLFDDPTDLPAWVARVSAVTSSNDIALATAVIFAFSCWRAAHPEILPPSLASLMSGLVDPRIWKDCLRAHFIMCTEDEQALLEFAKSTGYSNKPLDCAANGFALTGIPWVVYHGLKAQTFEEGLVAACSNGGDTDTICAMVGCLMALRLGREAIPMWMINDLSGLCHLEDPTLWHPVQSEAAALQEAILRE